MTYNNFFNSNQTLFHETEKHKEKVGVCKETSKMCSVQWSLTEKISAIEGGKEKRILKI